MKRPSKRLLVIGGASGAIAAAAAGVALTAHGAANSSTPMHVVRAAAVQQPNAPAVASELPAATDPDGPNGPNDQTTVDATPETSAPEAPGTSESATAADGPGGHEDNPADASAAHEFNGTE